MFAKNISLFAVSIILLTIAPQIVCGKPTKSAAEIGENRALALVEKVKEVQRWEKEFGPKRFNPRTNGRPAFNVEEHHGSVYLVNVFEDKPEQALTFARYEVNIKSGRVKKVD